jgi:hypothetical protein
VKVGKSRLEKVYADIVDAQHIPSPTVRPHRDPDIAGALFSLGYITQVDIYLDTAWAAGNSDWRFDWDTAIRDNALNFDSDYVFNVGTQLSGDNTPGFWAGTVHPQTRARPGAR